MPVPPRTPTSTETAHLKKACRDPKGLLPDGVSTRLLKAMLDAGYIYRADADGYRIADANALDYDGVTTWRITLPGRRAVLTRAQWRALSEQVGADGAFTPKVNYVTRMTLQALRLAEFRDGEGRLRPTDGSTGLRGPQFGAFPTAVGRDLAELARGEADG
ncbi:hypothetical protein [Streptomyces sp. NBC_01304]|uniref:hypothetical protein n=1 Tax=Streptomyces sp. NBC_01304 TaxID=2903818 RepID=UPI002E0EB1BD|nr:hypothetical protein OG430_47830 [Streptomyces sp. NBC_01304]